MADSTPSAARVEDLGRILVTGGSGFVGANLVTTLLDRGFAVRSFDRAPSPLPAHPRLEVLEGDICDPDSVAAAVDGVDTVFHTAAIIDLMGGKRIKNGDETLPYTERFNDLYTETKVVAEKFVLSQNGVDGLLTCSIRPSGIWGPGDQTMFRKVFENVLAGNLKVLVGNRRVKLDNSYVHNLIHGFILAAQHLVPGGSAPGQAYFINDGEPINMFEFSRPVLEACGQPYPRIRVPGRLVWLAVTVWQWLHFRFGAPKPLIEPLGVERVILDNYFSIAKARRDLGYRPLYTTDEAMAECLPYYVELFHQMKSAGEPAGAAAR